MNGYHLLEKPVRALKKPKAILERERVYSGIKRAVDAGASAVGLVVLSPVFAGVALAVLMEDGRPVFHVRQCTGKEGRTYKMYKFRTMVKDADDFSKYFTQEQLAHYMREAKVADDPRITRTGRFLRRTSLDELPQLLSVLKGDMSLVGPRPMVGHECDNYDEETLEAVLEATPGMTGYWQVYGRGSHSYKNGRRQQDELFYARHRSLWMDAKLLLLTIPSAVSGKGAS